MYPLHEQYVGSVNAPPERVFAVLDDHTRLTEHMNRRSWKLGWGRMETTMDAQHGRAVGSRIALAGRVFGIRLSLEEVVTERVPPIRKSWETSGEPRLLVIGPYRMGFELTPTNADTSLRVWIDYDLPARGLSRLLGKWIGRMYARWCTIRMVNDTRRSLP